MKSVEQIINDIATICKERPANWQDLPDETTYYTDTAIEHEEIWTFYLDKDSTSVTDKQFILFVCNVNDEPFCIYPIDWAVDKDILLVDIAEEIYKDFVRHMN